MNSNDDEDEDEEEEEEEEEPVRKIVSHIIIYKKVILY